jgi:small subunit ribosomal protein S9
MAKRKNEVEEKAATAAMAAETATVAAGSAAPAATTAATAAAKAEAAEKRKKRRAAKKIVTVSATRKASVARATVKPGKAVFRYNKLHMDAIENPYVREIVMEPIRIANDFASTVDIEVNVTGGGAFSQAQAARTAIARGLVAFSKDSVLKDTFLKHDRYLLVEDQRKVEPKKYMGRKARARFQKSYR